MKSYPAKRIAYYPISKQFRNPANDDPSLIIPLNSPPPYYLVQQHLFATPKARSRYWRHEGLGKSEKLRFSAGTGMYR